MTEKSIKHRPQVYREILSKYSGESLQGQDFDVVLELLKQHPKADEKIGVGIKDLLVDSDGYGGQCFHLVRQDGTKDDFSYLKCLGYKKNKKNSEPAVFQKIFWKMFLNQRLVFQLKSGAIIEGTLEGEYYIFIKIVDAVITGKNVVTKTDWVMVDKSQVGHIYPVGVMIERMPVE